MKRISFSGFFFFLLITSTALGQNVKKKPITEKDYHQWHTMTQMALSENGKWATYTFAYDGKQDTTFVKAIKGKRKYSFPQSNDPRLNNDWFSCMQDSTLQLLHLKSDKVQRISSVRSYAFVKNNWLVLHINDNGEALLLVIDSEGKQRYRFENTQQYILNPSGTSLLLVQRVNSTKSLQLLSLVDGMKEHVTNVSNDPIVHVSWDEQYNTVAFFDKGANNPTLFLYRSNDKKLYQVRQEGNWEGEILYAMEQIAVINKGSELLFWTTKKQTEKEKSYVNIWNAQDDVLQIRRKKYPRKSRTLCSWLPNTGKVQVFENNEVIKIEENGHFAIRKDSRPYLPSAKLDSDADYYIRDLVTGEESLFLKAYGASGTITLLPDGKTLLYFKAKHWWQYSLKTATHQNLTDQLPVSFVNETFEGRDADYPVGLPLVAEDDSCFLLYDANDIWQMNTSGGHPIRLTRGKEKNQLLRVADVELTANKNPEWMINKGKTYTANAPLLLTVRSVDYSEQGFGWLDKSVFKVLWMKPKLMEILTKVNNDLMLRTQSFDCPPELLLWEGKKEELTVVVKSNPQHEKYAWGHSKSVYYKNSNGVPLQAVLYYPANYDAKKKYPMAVNIYQKRGYEQHYYRNPSYYNGVGFNISNLTSKGYFVLFPDIIYELGNPGISALDCTMSAVRDALEVKSIDSANVALIGHSYGGYETNFIITQTSFFKTAIASAGVTDFSSRYYSMSENHLAPETWRFEFQQFRMKGPLYNYRAEYRSNSPIEHVEHITTPLLTWTGENDTQVNPYQSMEFYLALRRLGKQHIMLTYPAEGHVLLEPEKQKDLTHKMEGWLDYYLKNEVQPSWMKVNYQYQTP